MMPLIPPSTITDLAGVHFQESPETRHIALSNADRLFGDDVLPPDPVFMGVVTRGPIGRLVARLAAWREAREARQLAAEQPSTAAAHPGSGRTLPPSTIADREHDERDLAA